MIQPNFVLTSFDLHSQAKPKRDLGGNVIKVEPSYSSSSATSSSSAAASSAAGLAGGDADGSGAKKVVEEDTKSFKREREEPSNESGNAAKKQKPSLPKPPLQRQLSDTGGAQNAEATGKISQDDVIAELMKMGGRMPLKQLLKAFKKVLKNKVIRENFMSYLKNVTRTEKDAVTGATIIVLKQQFGGLSN
jgi:hypothetical protein